MSGHKLNVADTAWASQQSAVSTRQWSSDTNVLEWNLVSHGQGKYSGLLELVEFTKILEKFDQTNVQKKEKEGKDGVPFFIIHYAFLRLMHFQYIT